MVNMAEDYNPLTGTLGRDFFNLMCGDLIGEGQYRKVYEFKQNPKFVIKMEDTAYSFSNIREWDLWLNAECLPEARKWLAPCSTISPNGIFLIQERTTPARRFPDKLPVWLTDIKRNNFGMLGGKFVAHDYGNNLVCNSGLTKRLKKVTWG